MSKQSTQYSIDQLEFTPIPPQRRRSPARTQIMPGRFYIERFVEHREAAEFLEEVGRVRGRGAGKKALVRALLHYRDTVMRPLEELRESSGGRPARIPRELAVALLEFTPIEGGSGKVKHLSARLYVDRWVEHREAYEFLQRLQRLHIETNTTIIKALLHYRDTVYRPLQSSSKRGSRARSTRRR